MTKQIAIGAFVTEFLGGFPDVPLAPGVDLSGLDDEGAPFFVTLPIIPRIGQVSGNGLLYDDALAATIEEQINSKRPGANFGHLPSDQRGDAFPHPKAFWVGAVRVGETLWAKAYVPAGAAREHLRNLKAVGGRIATSIFGSGDFEKVSKGVQRLVNFVLETVDFAPPERAALGYSAPVIVTAEMASDDEPATEQEHEMSTAEVIQELRGVVVPANKGWKPPANDGEVSELVAIRETLGVSETADLRQLVSELLQEREESKRVAVAARIGELVAEGVKVASVRSIVTELIEARDPKSVKEAEAAYQAVIAKASVKEMLEAAVVRESGPAAIVNGRVRETGRKPLVDTPENRAKAAAAMGINI